ncbi:hypothetical protein [Massilia pseudoviolaceinigra]|uniref:hypothetical protein n=1 Tax=Massilia pseudoviolaceinigra TaxID=3057165 RepID=UPI002796D4FA|nr:hypothetical protein [Massilia sp. CCM 9206]MDQ1923547.1 hypothetical protein [Massilia sp. CCM 9206]
MLIAIYSEENIMWIGSIGLVAATKNVPNAETDNLVQASIIRNGTEIRVLNLDYAEVDDHERGDSRGYTYSGPTKLPRRNDLTPVLPAGIGTIPMPYPGYGLEFSHGLSGHLQIKLRVNGDDMWIKDNIDLYVKFIRLRAIDFGTLAWLEDTHWTYIASWTQDVALSNDDDEGVPTWTLNLG